MSIKNIYKKSVNGNDCIGPCYKKNTLYYHPITLYPIIVQDTNTCPIKRKYDNKKNRTIYHDTCLFPQENAKNIDEENIVISNMIFDYSVFIKIYYNIHTVEELYNWLNNTEGLYITKKRVFETGINVFNDEINIIDDKLVNIIVYIFKENMDYMYPYIRPYLKIQNDNVFLTEKDTKYKNDSDIDIKTCDILKKYIEDTFISTEEVHKFMVKIIKYKNNILKEEELVKILMEYFVEYIIKKIEITIY
jgi:hypothetical protein